MARGLVPEDLANFVWVEDPQIHPDGNRVAYVRRGISEDGKGYRSVIRCHTREADTLLTNGTGRDWAPRWSRDGHLAFLSDRGGTTQLWLLRAEGGEAVRLTDSPYAPSPAIFSPDGQYLLYTAAVRDEERELEPGYADDVRVIRRLHHKTNGAGFHEDRHQHIFVADLAGEVRRLTDGPYDHQQPAWSPDGRHIAFTARRSDDADLIPMRDIHWLPIEGGDPAPLTSGNLVCQSPVFSPDGDLIVFAAHDLSHFRATNSSLYAITSPTAPSRAPARDLLAGFDRELGSHILNDMRGANLPAAIFSPDGQKIHFFADEGGTTRLLRVPRDGGTSEELLSGDRAFFGFSLHRPTGRYVVGATDSTAPGDLFSGRIGEPGEERITDSNPWLSERALSRPERFSCETASGLRIEGWAMPPVSGSAVPAPTILEIHGGPHAAYGEAFFHEFQCLAAQGYAVVYCNPRGSTGYGQEFAALIQDHWGVTAQEDVLAVLDAAISRFPFIDGDRLGITGGSFGGYLTNWIIAHTDRFRAAVTQRSVANRYSFVLNNDVGYHSMAEYGEPWNNPQHYRDSSPVAFVEGIHTPLLILHSEQDLRCPIEQAEQLFTALKVLGREVEFVRFPQENHELSRNGQPRHRVDRLWRIVRWFLRYLPASAQ